MRRLGVAAVSALGISAVLLVASFALGAAVVPSGQTVNSGAVGGFALFPPPANVSSVPLKHVVVVMMENHAFDNFFGTYCTVLGPHCAYAVNGIPNGTCVPYYPSNPSKGCVRPYPFANGSSMYQDQPHNWHTSHVSYDNGSNDGFYQAEHAGTLPFGYWTGKSIPGDWVYAEEYGLGANFYSSTLSYSLPNHWFMLGGGVPNAAEMASVETYAGDPTLTPVQEQYLNESNTTPAIDGPLMQTSLSWKYYDWPLQPTYQAAVNLRVSGGTFAFWNPLASQSVAYQSNLSSHFVDRSTFYSDAAAGTLPTLSWVIPDAAHSDHPPYNVTWGMQFLMKLLGSVESSPQWNSTAVFVTWDEYGGFYDHVAPPQIDSYGLGFRVPLLVVGPYVRQGYVSDHLGYFESFLKLMEWKFRLGNLTARDLNAPLPLEYFDFGASPRAPLLLPGASSITYPQPSQSLPPPGPVTNLNATTGSGSVTLTWNPPTGGSPTTVYRIHYGPHGNPAKFTVRVDGAADGYVLTGLPANVTYGYTVQAAASPGGSFGLGKTVNATPTAGSALVGAITLPSSLAWATSGNLAAIPTRLAPWT